MLVSDHTVDDTMTKIQAAAADVNLSVERSNNKVCEALLENRSSLPNLNHSPLSDRFFSFYTAAEDATISENGQVFSFVLQLIGRGKKI